MRRLTKSERRLLLFLGGAIFLMANFYGLSYLADEQSDVSRRLNEAAGKERSAQLWLRERNLWLTRKQWLEARQPKVDPKAVPQSELLQTLTKSASESSLQIQEQGFGETKITPDYRSVAVKLKLTGTLQNVVKWLVQIQQPDRFQAVTNFSLKSAAQPPGVTLELEVARWYAPTTHEVPAA